MREINFQIHLTADEKKKFDSAADMTGLSISSWARSRLLIAAHEEFRNALQLTPMPQKPMAAAPLKPAYNNGRMEEQRECMRCGLIWTPNYSASKHLLRRCPRCRDRKWDIPKSDPCERYKFYGIKVDVTVIQPCPSKEIRKKIIGAIGYYHRLTTRAYQTKLIGDELHVTRID